MAKTVMGLKSMRKVSGQKPTYNCDNCKCVRYSPCGCMRKHKSNEANDKD